VTGTENLMMAACLAEGHDGARERRARARGVDLARCLIAMGRAISGHGSAVVTIEGVDALSGVEPCGDARSHRGRHFLAAARPRAAT
jgi:UDP-N-acetylglucosamine 1-carboxyvinyltransferase